MTSRQVTVARSAWALSVLLCVPACSEGDLPPPVSSAGTSSSDAGSGGAAGNGSSGTGASGAAGTAGTAGTGGAAGSGSGTPDPVSVTLGFDTTLETFAVNYYCTAVGTCTPITAPAPVADAGADAGGGTGPGSEFFVVEHDTQEGDPTPGSARMTIQFSGAGQSVELAYNIPTVNWTNKQASIRVRLASGPVGTTAKMYVKTAADYNYADSGQVTLTAGETWTTLSYPPTAGGMISIVTPGAYDIADVREIGIEVAANPTVLTPAVLYVDTLAY